MYEKLGYAACSCVRNFTCQAGEPLPLRKIGGEEYATLRRQFLPEDGVLQEGVSIDYLASYAQFFAGADFVLAGLKEGTGFLGIELLGNRSAAPGILAALDCQHGSFRCPGGEIPFAMFLPLREDADEPGYLGLVFD